MPHQSEPRGKVTISEDVIRQIAETATREVEGVLGIHGEGGIFQKKPSKSGIDVKMEENRLGIGISITLLYGASIPEVSWKVQENVFRAVQKITGKEVVEVNVNIAGIGKGETK